MDNMIYGTNPLSLIDYPGEITYIIFLGGCNFACPYCHNREIVLKTKKPYLLDDVLKEIKERKKLITSVTITGGEPTIYNDKLIKLITLLKKLNLKIKLDTNGTNPDLLMKIINQKLVDYIAMDIKNVFSKYEETVKKKVNIADIKKSIKLMEEDKIDYEFRLTVNKTMHSIQDIKKIYQYIRNKDKLFIQLYKQNENQLSEIRYKEYKKEELLKKIDYIKIR